MTTHSMIQTDRAMGQSAKRLTRHLPTVARVLFGLVFLAAGLSGLLMAAGIMSPPQPSTHEPAGADAFVTAVMKTGYLFSLIKGTEAIVGALLLSNRFVPLALALIAPVIVNILAFHAFLAPSGIGVGVVLVILEVYLAWTYRETYRPLFVPRRSAGAR